MRRLLLAAVSVLLCACGEPAAGPPPPEAPLPDVTGSYVLGSRAAPHGGEAVVGLLVPAPASRPLADLLPPEAWAAFQAQEAAREGAAPAEGAPASEEEVVEEGVWEGDWDDTAARALHARDEALAAAAAALAEQTGVEVRFQAVLARECAGLPLVISDGPVTEPGDREALRAYVAAGGRLLVADAGAPAGDDLGVACPGVLPAEKGAIETLVAACRETLTTSRAIREVPGEAPALSSARREGDRVLVRFASAPLEVTLRDLGDAVLARATSEADGSWSVLAPDPELDPHAHRLVARWQVGALALRRAWSVADLVGALQRQVFAEGVAEPGSTFAAHVLYRRGAPRSAPGGAATPAAGVEERVALVRGDTLLAEAQGRTGLDGSLAVALAVPPDLAPGPATLQVGSDAFPVVVRSARRVHVTTDRPLYRPTDVVHVRVMVHEPASGRGVAGEAVTLKLGDAEQRVTTSAHGIASATFPLFEARPGRTSVRATAGTATAQAALRVRAFERPTFSVTTEPERLALRAGETAPFVLVARYVNGAPLVGARVTGGAGQGLRATDVQGVTDAQGRFAGTIGIQRGSLGGTYTLSVRDADGRWVDHALPVEVPQPDRGPRVALVALEDPVVGLPCRVALRASAPGTWRLDVAGETPRRVEVGASGASAPFTLVPDAERMALRVVDEANGVRTLTLAAQAWDGHRPLVTPQRKTALVGETLGLSLRGADGPVRLDVRRDGLLLRALGALLERGRAQVDIPLDADLAGLLTLRAWRPGDPAGAQADGSLVRVLVARGRALQVDATAGRDDYRPAETAQVDVTVRDRDGRPTAAVLGYWGVDEALLLLAPWGGADEEVFDVLADGASEDQRDLARLVERRGETLPDAVTAALGTVTSRTFERDLAGIRHATAAVRGAQAEAAAARRFDAAFEALRARWLDAFGRVPLAQIRTAASLREQTSFLLRGGWLAPAELLDPWGTALSLGDAVTVRRRETHRSPSSWSWREEVGTPCRSAGPDLRFGTGDDLLALWRPWTVFDVPGRLGRFLCFVHDHAASADGAWLRGLPVVPFWGPADNMTIGLGGGAGGAFAGRGGGRDLGTGGGGRKPFAEPPVHLRRDFEPTLCFVPEAIVGPEGRTRLSIPLKDAITTWRLRLVASAADGATGVGAGSIRVTQPLHAEPWVAPHLTVGDELDLPVALRNETAVPLDVDVSLVLSPHLAVVGDGEARVRVEAGGTGAWVARIRATQPGAARVRIDCDAGAHRDAIQRLITVHRLARADVACAGGVVTGAQPFVAALPPLAAEVPRDRRLTVFPTPMAETLGGLEGLIACPHG